MPKTTMTKQVGRQLRLTTPVNSREKKIAERLARDEGYPSVAELVRQLIAERHQKRMKRLAAKKEREKNGAKKASGRGATKLLPLGKAGASAKPSRSKTSGNRTRRSSTNRPSSKSPKNRVVAVSHGNIAHATGNRSKTSSSTNRSTELG
jgi:hypothetical protein